MILSCDVVFKKVYILSLESKPFFRRYKNNFDSVVPQEVSKFLLSIHQPSHPLLGSGGGVGKRWKCHYRKRS